MVFDSIPSLNSLDECIVNPKNPIGMRMRAAYYLRHIHSTTTNNDNGDDTTTTITTADQTQERVVQILEKGMLDPNHGSLLRHEFAYVMGQMKDVRVSRMEVSCIGQRNFTSPMYIYVCVCVCHQCHYFDT